MKIEVSIPFQASIKVENAQFEVVGPLSLLNKVNDLKQRFGAQVESWPLLKNCISSDDVLINELIRKSKGEIFIYNHDELCHCRMVTTEVVKNAVKAGCHSVNEVSRTTLAGTGCGSCKSDIENVIKALKTE